MRTLQVQLHIAVPAKTKTAPAAALTFTNNRTTVPPWLQLTRWSTYLHGRTLCDVAKLADVPQTDLEPLLGVFVKAWTTLSNKLGGRFVKIGPMFLIGFGSTQLLATAKIRRQTVNDRTAEIDLQNLHDIVSSRAKLSSSTVSKLLEYKPLNAARECGVTFFSQQKLILPVNSSYQCMVSVDASRTAWLGT
jgi:hypothetical protein